MPEILRTMELVRQMLDEIIELRHTAGGLETAKRLGEICLQKTGLPLDYVKRSAPDEILRLLEEGGAMQPIRAIILAELLLSDAEINRDEGRVRDAAIERAQAYVFIAASIDKLSVEDQIHYRSKMAALKAGIVNE